jgi:transposase-like protein
MSNPQLDPVVLSDEERSVLTGWARRRKTSQALALRCAEGGTIGEVAGEIGVSRNTVSKWRSRFVAHRLDGLSDEPRPGRPRVIGDEQIEQVITKTLEETPGADTHWSTRSHRLPQSPLFRRGSRQPEPGISDHGNQPADQRTHQSTGIPFPPS